MRSTACTVALQSELQWVLAIGRTRPHEVRGSRGPEVKGGAVSATFDAERSGLSRRELFAAGAAAGVAATVEAETADAASRSYPRLRVVALGSLRVNRPVRFNYPLEAQSNILLDLGAAVPGGVGPKKSIVAFSTLCQHMGCDVDYRSGPREFVCPCHQTRYDPERLAAIIEGVATRALPRVLLEVRDGAVYAIGVDGLIYGYRTNLAPGKEAS
jgi:arsenite oxidase small subunit